MFFSWQFTSFMALKSAGFCIELFVRDFTHFFKNFQEPYYSVYNQQGPDGNIQDFYHDRGNKGLGQGKHGNRSSQKKQCGGPGGKPEQDKLFSRVILFRGFRGKKSRPEDYGQGAGNGKEESGEKT